MKLDTIINQAVIETDRLTLRPLRKDDIGALQLFASDDRVARMTRDIAHPLPPGAVEAYVARAQADDRVEDVWVMDGSTSGQGNLLGLISLQRMDRAQSEIAYWVVPAFWNTGLASEAVRALVGANPRGDQTMFASVFQDNPASARVLTNAGFEYLGDAEAFSVARGSVVPTWTYLKRLT